MKFFYCLLSVLVFSNSFAQDIIMKTDGDLIRAKVTKITPDDIEYRLFNNLDGPLYVLPSVDIQKIDFENGTVQSFAEVQEEKELTREDLKDLIVENINKYAYTHNGQYRYHAEFEKNHLKLRFKGKRHGELGKTALYELDGDCVFHTLSIRNSGIAYINVILNQVYNESLRQIDTTRRFSKPVSKKSIKLVIRVKDQDKAEIIRNAMIRYNLSFH